MISCPFCDAQNLNAKKGCLQCGFVPAEIDGFVAWAPELARKNDGFPEESFEKLASVEANNFWFRSRNSIIVWALRKYFPDFYSLLEVGCGTGFVLKGVSEAFPCRRLAGSEIHTAGLSFASQRVPDAELFQMDARYLPYESEFDVVTAFDVIEHIVEDELVLQNLHRAIKPGGGCLLTVPQHQWLWSPIDDAACHQRRYSATELHSKVAAVGFRILRSTSFVSLLLPLMLASRLKARRSNGATSSEAFALNPKLDRLLGAIMHTEHQLIRSGLNFPLGGSRLVVAIKE